MISNTHSLEKHVSAGIRLISAAIIFLTVFILSLLFLVTYPLDIVMPRQLFSLWGLAVVISASLILSTAVVVYIRRLSKRPKNVSPMPARHDKRKRMIRGSIYLVILIVILGGVFGIIQTCNQRSSAELLERSRSHIRVFVHGEVPEERVNATLVELEKNIRDLRSEYRPQVNYEITLELYEDEVEFQEKTKAPKGAAGSYRYDAGRHIISIPAESGVLWLFQTYETKGTPRPAHEATHAVVMELAGSKYKDSIPLWFYEGLADYESLKKCSELRTRVCNRYFLWYLWSQMATNNEHSLLYLTDYPKEELDFHLFYFFSHELVRYIALEYGDTALCDIPAMLAEGNSFDSALSSSTGCSIEALYDKWARQFYGNSEQSESRILAGLRVIPQIAFSILCMR